MRMLVKMSASLMVRMVAPSFLCVRQHGRYTCDDQASNIKGMKRLLDLTCLRHLLLLLLIAFVDDCASLDYPAVWKSLALQFPRDHGAHPQYRTEWWYVSAWVKDETEEQYGIQITFFRNRPGVQESNPLPLAPKQLMFGQVAIANARLGRLLHEQRAARMLPGVFAAAEGDLDLRMQDWHLAHRGSHMTASGKGREFAWELSFESTQSLMLQGEAGYSRKGPREQEASYYYSVPQLKVSGTLTVRGQQLTVFGSAWMDHEWFSAPLPVTAVGWDWVGINFDDGRALTAFRVRDAAGHTLWAGASLRSADGRLRVMTPDEVVLSPGRRWRSTRTQTDYPVEWKLKLPGLNLSLMPMLDDQELDGRASHGAIYWEGAVRAYESDRLSGHGYLEMTGYTAPIKF
jgi:predicted secreted hydrolase